MQFSFNWQAAQLNGNSISLISLFFQIIVNINKERIFLFIYEKLAKQIYYNWVICLIAKQNRTKLPANDFRN